MTARCQHEKLCFDSGGHFVRCLDCGVNWVAVVDAHGPGQKIDYDRSQAKLFATDIRVKP